MNSFKTYLPAILYRISMVLGFWLLLPAVACNKSSARNEVLQFEWEQSDALSTHDLHLAYRVDTFFQNKSRLSGLNGAVLIAYQGKVIYRKNFGFSNHRDKTPLTDSTTFQLASVSKPITAVAILLLHEKKQLDIDLAVAKYIQGFPYPDITIRNLLNHRSGLANYIYLFDTMKEASGNYITNKEVMDYFIEHKPALQATPGKRFQYCNTNYAFLALLVEAVSRQPFAEFVQDHIFVPAHMFDTYVRDVADSIRHPNQTFGYIGSKWELVTDVPYDGVVGDKGIYTTTWDLFLFDQALNHGILLNEALLREAYKGYSYEKPGQKNYGLGWRLKEFEDSSRIVYHNGWWRGYNTLFARDPGKGTSIIVLSNKLNRNVYNVGTLYEMLGLGAGLRQEGEE